MKREKYINMPNHRRLKPAAIRMKAAPPVTALFPIGWQPEPGDWEDIEAAVIEGLMLLTRRRDHLLRRHEPLSKVGQYKPNGSDRLLSEMSADELHLRVEHLRETAARARAQATIDAEMDAAE